MPVRSLLDQMLIQETSKRSSAADMLSQWQELYLTLCKRERDDERAGRLLKTTEAAPDRAAQVRRGNR